MQNSIPRLNVRTVFIDIDTTITDPFPEAQKDNELHSYLLARLVAKANDISIDLADKQIKEAEFSVGNMVGKEWPFGILENFNATDSELWALLVDDAKRRLFMHPDAKKFLIGLKNYPGIKVYTATTNPKISIYAKLSVGDLADQSGSSYLHDAFGGEEVSPGGKSTPEFYKALLQRTGASPETTLMVGDNPEMDLKLANAAGIKQVVLVRREQAENWTYCSDGALYVNGLEEVLNFLS